MTLRYYKRIPNLFFVAAFVLSFHTARSQSVMQKLKSNRQTSHFAQALEKANLDNRLNGDGPFTLFAPTNQAFDRLNASQKVDKKILLNHIFTGLASERSLEVMTEVTCLSGKTIKLKNIDHGKSVSVGSYSIVNSNIKADNGIIHVINGVIR